MSRWRRREACGFCEEKTHLPEHPQAWGSLWPLQSSSPTGSFPAGHTSGNMRVVVTQSSGRLLFTWCFCHPFQNSSVWHPNKEAEPETRGRKFAERVTETRSPGWLQSWTCKLCALLTFDPLERFGFVGGKRERRTFALPRIK